MKKIDFKGNFAVIGQRKKKKPEVISFENSAKEADAAASQFIAENPHSCAWVETK